MPVSRRKVILILLLEGWILPALRVNHIMEAVSSGDDAGIDQKSVEETEDLALSTSFKMKKTPSEINGITLTVPLTNNESVLGPKGADSESTTSSRNEDGITTSLTKINAIDEKKSSLSFSLMQTKEVQTAIKELHAAASKAMDPAINSLKEIKIKEKAAASVDAVRNIVSSSFATMKDSLISMLGRIMDSIMRFMPWGSKKSKTSGVVSAGDSTEASTKGAASSATTKTEPSKSIKTTEAAGASSMTQIKEPPLQEGGCCGDDEPIERTIKKIEANRKAAKEHRAGRHGRSGRHGSKSGRAVRASEKLDADGAANEDVSEAGGELANAQGGDLSRNTSLSVDIDPSRIIPPRRPEENKQYDKLHKIIRHKSKSKRVHDLTSQEQTSNHVRVESNGGDWNQPSAISVQQELQTAMNVQSQQKAHQKTAVTVQQQQSVGVGLGGQDAGPVAVILDRMRSMSFGANPPSPLMVLVLLSVLFFLVLCGDQASAILPTSVKAFIWGDADVPQQGMLGRPGMPAQGIPGMPGAPINMQQMSAYHGMHPGMQTSPNGMPWAFATHPGMQQAGMSGMQQGGMTGYGMQQGGMTGYGMQQAGQAGFGRTGAYGMTPLGAASGGAANFPTGPPTNASSQSPSGKAVAGAAADKAVDTANAANKTLPPALQQVAATAINKAPSQWNAPPLGNTLGQMMQSGQHGQYAAAVGNPQQQQPQQVGMGAPQQWGGQYQWVGTQQDPYGSYETAAAYGQQDPYGSYGTAAAYAQQNPYGSYGTAAAYAQQDPSSVAAYDLQGPWVQQAHPDGYDEQQADPWVQQQENPSGYGEQQVYPPWYDQQGADPDGDGDGQDPSGGQAWWGQVWLQKTSEDNVDDGAEKQNDTLDKSDNTAKDLVMAKAENDADKLLEGARLTADAPKEKPEDSAESAADTVRDRPENSTPTVEKGDHS